MGCSQFFPKTLHPKPYTLVNKLGWELFALKDSGAVLLDCLLVVSRE